MKTLGQLAALVEGAHIDGGSEQIEITGIEHDSRKVRSGTLFVAIPGVHVDGAKFIPQAVQQGALAVLAAEGHELAAPAGVAVLRVPELNAALDAIVPYFHDYPARSLRVIGITGTNGKTTTSYLVRAILRHAGYKVGLIGTIQIMIEDEVLPIHNTTPDVVELQNTLARMRDAGMDYVVMEVSSHALDQNRVAGIEFDTAVFTNLTQDHLDYHKTLENYMRAKARLFDHVSEAGVKQGKTAVVNIDETTRRGTSCSRTRRVRISPMRSMRRRRTCARRISTCARTARASRSSIRRSAAWSSRCTSRASSTSTTS